MTSRFLWLVSDSVITDVILSDASRRLSNSSSLSRTCAVSSVPNNTAAAAAAAILPACRMTNAGGNVQMNAALQRKHWLYLTTLHIRALGRTKRPFIIFLRCWTTSASIAHRQRWRRCRRSEGKREVDQLQTGSCYGQFFTETKRRVSRFIFTGADLIVSRGVLVPVVRERQCSVQPEDDARLSSQTPPAAAADKRAKTRKCCRSESFKRKGVVALQNRTADTEDVKVVCSVGRKHGGFFNRHFSSRHQLPIHLLLYSLYVIRWTTELECSFITSTQPHTLHRTAKTCGSIPNGQ